MTTFTGSCLCGKVRFEVVGNFEHFFLCHCDYCRKDTGSAFAANLFSSTATLNWLAGEHGVRVFHLPDTRHVKSFCGTCGSALPSEQMGGDLVVVPAGSLDGEPGIAPCAHIFVDSRATWEDELGGAPRFAGAPS